MDDIDRSYEILGLSPGASEEKVKEAFRDLVKVWHPDRFSHDPKLQRKAQEKLKDINWAYQRLEYFFRNPHSRPSGPRPQAKTSSSPRTSRPRQFKPRPKPSFSSGTRGDFVKQVQSALMIFESRLRAALLIFGYRLPSLTVEGRIKALLLFLGTIYFFVLAIYFVATL